MTRASMVDHGADVCGRPGGCLGGPVESRARGRRDLGELHVSGIPVGGSSNSSRCPLGVLRAVDVRALGADDGDFHFEGDTRSGWTISS